MSISAKPVYNNGDHLSRRSLLIGIAVWFLHLNVVYGLASLSCVSGWLSFTLGDLSALQVIEIAISAISAMVMLILIYLPWREWRRFQSEKPTGNQQLLEETEKDRRPFLAFITMLLNGLFLLFMIGFVVPVVALNPCVQG